MNAMLCCRNTASAVVAPSPPNLRRRLRSSGDKQQQRLEPTDAMPSPPLFQPQSELQLQSELQPQSQSWRISLSPASSPVRQAFKRKSSRKQQQQQQPQAQPVQPSSSTEWRQPASQTISASTALLRSAPTFLSDETRSTAGTEPADATCAVTEELPSPSAPVVGGVFRCPTEEALYYFRSFDSDDDDSGGEGRPSSSLLSLKRANPVYDSDDDEYDDYLEHSLSSPFKKLRTSASSPSATMAENDHGRFSFSHEESVGESGELDCREEEQPISRGGRSARSGSDSPASSAYSSSGDTRDPSRPMHDSSLRPSSSGTCYYLPQSMWKVDAFANAGLSFGDTDDETESSDDEREGVVKAVTSSSSAEPIFWRDRLEA